MELSSLNLTTHLDSLEIYAQHKQGTEIIAQQCFKQFLTELETYLCSQKCHLEPETFQNLCRRISRIDFCYSIPEPILKTICIISQIILPEAPSNSLLSYSNLYKLTCSLIESVIYFPATFQNLFIDGQHPWKQKKYEIVLKAIEEAFKVKDSVDLKAKLFELQAVKEENRTSLQNMTLLWLKPLIERSNDPRSDYRQFITGLRVISQDPFFIQQKELALEGKEHHPLAGLALNVCYYRFTEVHLYTFSENLVRMMIYDGKKNLVPLYQGTEQEVFALTLREQFEAIHAASLHLKEPILSGLIQRSAAATEIFNDPQLKSNIPYVLCDLILNQNHSLRVLRMGTPNNSKLGVNPEFKVFLSKCLEKGEKVLFVSEQAMNSLVERTRNELNIKLTLEFPLTFFMVILPKDTEFYKQMGAYISPYLLAADFKDSFLSQLKLTHSGFYFDEKWLSNSSFLERVTNCLNEVHQDVFANERLLNREQRLDFIEITYARLIYDILTFLKIDYKSLINFLVVACRDTNDRGVVTLILLLALSLLYLGKYNDPEMQTMLNVFMHSPKLMVLKDVMNYRRERLISALSTLNHPEVIISLGVRQKLKSMLSDIHLLKLPDQEL